MKLFSKWSACALVATTGALLAQNPGLKRTMIQKQDLSVPGREAVVARVELAPGAFGGRHTHPGEEISYLMEGEIDVLIEGKPPLHVKPGEAFVIPNGAKHDVHNTGGSTAKLVGVYVVEKDKPLATPAP